MCLSCVDDNITSDTYLAWREVKIKLTSYIEDDWALGWALLLPLTCAHFIFISKRPPTPASLLSLATVKTFRSPSPTFQFGVWEWEDEVGKMRWDLISFACSVTPFELFEYALLQLLAFPFRYFIPCRHGWLWVCARVFVFVFVLLFVVHRYFGLRRRLG